jgi:outer membrane receptor protein involved in Fe transport
VSLTAASLVQNGSFNLNVRKGKFGMNLFADGNLRPSVESPSSYNRVSIDTATNTNSILNQNGTGSFDRHGLQSGIGFDWSPDELNTFSGALSYNNFGVRSTGFVNQTEQTQTVSGGDYLDTKSINNTNRSFRQYSYDPSLNYKHSFKNKDQQLEFAADGSFANNMISSGNDQFLQPQDSLFYGTRNTNPAKEKEYEIKADYTQPVGKDVVFGAGGKFSGYDINTIANALVWNPNSMSYLYSPALSNDLTYHQKVYAAYAELTFPVGKLFESRLGARYERTQVNAFYANSRQKVQNGYNTVVPTIFLMKKIDENQTVKLNFTIRIGRPDYRDLNPYINASDPKNITTGNPNLKPEIWDLYEASYIRELGKTGSLMFTLFYRQSNGDIQQFLVYYPSIQIGDTIYNNVSVGTRENIGVEDNMGANLFFDFNINNKFNIQSNISFYYRHTINRINQGYNSNAMFYRSNINSSYHFTDNFAAEFFGSFSSRHHEIQGYFPSFVSYSFALRKNFLNDKLSVALTANNIFSKYVNQRTSLYGPGFQSTETRDIPFRTFGINFTWKFGELQSEKEKHGENPLNISAPE